MSRSKSQLGLRLLSIKAELDNGQLLTDDQLDDVIRGFEKGGIKEAKHAAGIISKAHISEEVWKATSEYLIELVEEAEVVSELDQDLSKAAYTAARVIAKMTSQTDIKVSNKTDLGESLVQMGTDDKGDPWLTAAGTLLLSPAMAEHDYEPPSGICKRIAEHLLALSRNLEGWREADLAAAGYLILGRADDCEHARQLVAESVDVREYLLRPEPNLQEGFLRFAGRLAEERPEVLVPYTIELATNLRADSFPVRRDAARAFAALSDAEKWESVLPGAYTLDGVLENEGPVAPIHALEFLYELADRAPEVLPDRVVEAFIRAIREDDRFTALYGDQETELQELPFRIALYCVFETLAPTFPEIVDAGGEGVVAELKNRDRAELESFVPAVGGVFAALDPDSVGEVFLEFLLEGVPSVETDNEISFDPDEATKTAMNQFANQVGDLNAAEAVSACDYFLDEAVETDGSREYLIIGALLLLAHQKRGDDELRSSLEESLQEFEPSEVNALAEWADKALCDEDQGQPLPEGA
ncbi:hypothetical protein [Natronoglomus mannanivorans]|uniref:Uncharacterized protein n=1 Tax=Natronoglomus mannanivorans TaxID=2979990 RepID=A0AAP3E4T0_9EURY|nr:hypothetical protein [Halobacteria archaeon AArc-xg1-1]